MSSITEELISATSKNLKIHRNQFWQAVWIWNTRPNIIKRNLCGVKTLYSFVFKCINISIENELDRLVNAVFSNNNKKLCLIKNVINYLNSYERIITCLECDTTYVSDKSYIILRKLLFKNSNYCDTYEICLISYMNDEIIYYQIADNTDNIKICSPLISFALLFCDEKISIKLINKNDNVKYSWLEYTLLPKLMKWAISSEPNKNFRESETRSLKLIKCDNYNELYLHLKDKYAKSLISTWPENTDPLKFVYEDIAIATYLCLLWSNKQVNFVDLGCGNGLLVHILSEENHKGFGIDIRERKIWSLYPKTTTLKVGTVTPECNNYFPQVDWIIGNHSDELTPWIPIFAARSSFECKFFLLPCCAYNLNGQRYQRLNSTVSVYNDYIEYIKSLCSKLGFKINIDKLRIPSTKRICLIGYERTYNEETYNDTFRKKIEEIQKNYLYNNESSISSFSPRENKQKVKNCTQIDKTVTSNILENISNVLIKNQLEFSQKCLNFPIDIWSVDYGITFNEAVLFIKDENLRILKHEHGGLKTLLKNNHSVFLIKNNKIYFRKPEEKTIESYKRKSRSCWFYHNHPLGCPLLDNKCSFIH